jgi:hypothetical protein
VPVPIKYGSGGDEKQVTKVSSGHLFILKMIRKTDWFIGPFV